jgi:hypothetical protein
MTGADCHINAASAAIAGKPLDLRLGILILADLLPGGNFTDRMIHEGLQAPPGTRLNRRRSIQLGRPQRRAPATPGQEFLCRVSELHPANAQRRRR